MKSIGLAISVVAITAALGGLGAGIGPFSQSVQAQGGPGMGSGMGWGRDYWMPGWMHGRQWDPQGLNQDMRARMQRHWTYMRDGLTKDYAGATSDVKTSAATIAEGGKLYDQSCASCHGKTGMGDGEAGKSLTPSPALLAYLIQRPVAVDEYLLWSISEGGKQFGTAMPAFKDTLKREEIWKIIGYMRAGFPESKEAK